jgi:hypothetical protein
MNVSGKQHNEERINRGTTAISYELNCWNMQRLHLLCIVGMYSDIQRISAGSYKRNPWEIYLELLVLALLSRFS